MKKWTKHEALGYLDKQIEVIHTLKLGRRGSSEHVRWLTNTLVFLEEIFGSDSYYYCNIKNLTWQFHGQRIYRGWDIDGAMEAYNQEAYVEQLEQANGFLLAAKDYLDANDIDTVYCASVEKQATGDLMKVLSLSEHKLRKVIRTKPEREKEIQDQFENLLIGADIEFEREGPHIDYSSKAYIPDFSFNSIDLAVEIKLCKTEEKTFIQADIQELFLSVGWVSGQYPSRLYKALMNSSTVVTAWDGNQLVGLVRLLDDSEMVAYMHYVLVRPDYQGQGIAGKMIEMVKEKYKDYLYIEIMPEESRNAAFYERHGFQVMADGVAMQLCNFGNRQ